jgi:hypothetical protein
MSIYYFVSIELKKIFSLFIASQSNGLFFTVSVKSSCCLLHSLCVYGCGLVSTNFSLVNSDVKNLLEEMPELTKPQIIVHKAVT